VYYQNDKIDFEQTLFGSCTGRGTECASGTPAGQRHSLTTQE
jgi:hypothetical protein